MPPLTSEDSPKRVPLTGVIYVMHRAAEHGYVAGAADWANLGQGAPETSEIPNCASRISQFPIDEVSAEYSPVAGTPDLRQAVADLYNLRYRKGQASQYTADNVAISAGGRMGLTRIAAVLDNCHLGHFIPDYTAYQELLDLFRGFIPIPIVNDDMKLPSTESLRKEIIGRGLGALLLSNPCNPTGDVLPPAELAQWVGCSRELGCTMIFDEFYAHYVYQQDVSTISAAAHVGDVNKDNILIVDGLTKNWRYPGLRLSWTVGPADTIRAISSAGSFLDGGAPHPVQNAALQLLEPETAAQEASAIRAHFTHKKQYITERLTSMGFVLDNTPEGSFYCFPSLRNLPKHLQDCREFFEAALEQKVITVPGDFFDVDPGSRRSHLPSRLRQHMRISYGPSLPELTKGLDRLEALVSSS